jgi:hypothetical protein
MQARREVTLEVDCEVFSKLLVDTKGDYVAAIKLLESDLDFIYGSFRKKNEEENSEETENE